MTTPTSSVVQLDEYFQYDLYNNDKFLVGGTMDAGGSLSGGINHVSQALWYQSWLASNYHVTPYLDRIPQISNFQMNPALQGDYYHFTFEHVTEGTIEGRIDASTGVISIFVDDGTGTGNTIPVDYGTLQTYLDFVEFGFFNIDSSAPYGFGIIDGVRYFGFLFDNHNGERWIAVSNLDTGLILSMQGRFDEGNLHCIYMHQQSLYHASVNTNHDSFLYWRI